MYPAVGIPCQRCDFERLAPTLPNNLCDKNGDSDALQIMDTKPQPSSALGQTTRPWKYADPKSKHLCGKIGDSDALHTTDTKQVNRMPPRTSFLISRSMIRMSMDDPILFAPKWCHAA